MVCQVCDDMLRKHVGRLRFAYNSSVFDHHSDCLGLLASADEGCGICIVVEDNLSRTNQLQDEESRRQHRTRVTLEYDRKFAVYLLKFKLLNLNEEEIDTANAGAIILQPTEQKPSVVLSTSDREGDITDVQKGLSRLRVGSRNASLSVSSPEIVRLAKDWIQQCQRHHQKCQRSRLKSRTGDYYPTRLIDIKAVSEGEKQLKLVSTIDEPKIEGTYITLSHCWGKAPAFIRLTDTTLSSFQQGFSMDDLPLTFQDAIRFSCRLGVGYIWIDSLCIIQEQDGDVDWLAESAQMDLVYNNSLCNISATAAEDSTKGLDFKAKRRDSWVDYATLNTKDIRPSGGTLEKCEVLDPSFWDQNIDDAPVNKRAWVLQERLIAPRVLHFCRNQLAWECWELDAAESHVPDVQLKGGELAVVGRLKGMDPTIDGQRIREIRLSAKDLEDLATHLRPEIFSYELWKRVVEVYSMTRLTQKKDKLIAVSGIAKTISGTLFGTYIAGMWQKHLEGQLLWSVQPGSQSVRPERYRAPTWSWASIDADNGIDYGDVIPQDRLLIRVTDVQVTSLPKGDLFGLITGGHIDVTGVLKPIQLVESGANDKIPYRWRLVIDGKATGKEHTIVRLDSPISDYGFIFGPSGRDHIYCLPAAASDYEEDLVCLILLHQPHKSPEKGANGTFKRIGLAKILPYHTDEREEVLKLSGNEADMPCLSWDGKEHTIRII